MHGYPGQPILTGVLWSSAFLHFSPPSSSPIDFGEAKKYSQIIFFFFFYNIKLLAWPFPISNRYLSESWMSIATKYIKLLWQFQLPHENWFHFKLHVKFQSLQMQNWIKIRASSQCLSSPVLLPIRWYMPNQLVLFLIFVAKCNSFTILLFSNIWFNKNRNVYEETENKFVSMIGNRRQKY